MKIRPGGDQHLGRISHLPSAHSSMIYRPSLYTEEPGTRPLNCRGSWLPFISIPFLDQIQPHRLSTLQFLPHIIKPKYPVIVPMVSSGIPTLTTHTRTSGRGNRLQGWRPPHFQAGAECNLLGPGRFRRRRQKLATDSTPPRWAGLHSNGDDLCLVGNHPQAEINHAAFIISEPGATT